MEDKRKVLSEARLQHLASMREKAAAKRKQTALEKENLAKQEVLSEIAEDQTTPTPVEPVEEEEPIQKEPPKKRIRQPVPENMYQPLNLDFEDMKLVKSFVQLEKERRKTEKWNTRKRELLQEVFSILDGAGEQHEDHQPEPQRQQSSLNLFDDYYY